MLKYQCSSKYSPPDALYTPSLLQLFKATLKIFNFKVFELIHLVSLYRFDVVESLSFEVILISGNKEKKNKGQDPENKGDEVQLDFIYQLETRGAESITKIVFFFNVNFSPADV